MRDAMPSGGEGGGSVGPPDLRDAAPPGLRHRRLELSGQHVEQGARTGVAAGRQGKEERPAEKDEVRPGLERLQNVLARPHASVERKGEPGRNRRADRAQRFERRRAPSSCRPPWLET